MTGRVIDPAPDTQSTLRFLEKRDLSGRWHLVAILPAGKVEARTFEATERSEASAWITDRQGVANLYYQVNTLKTGVRNVKARKSDVASAIYLHVDVDADDPEIVQRISDFLPPATFIVFSGGGYQLFWRLSTPCEDLARVERCNKALATALGGDNCHNIDRLMRLPGTINIPNERKRAKGRRNALACVVEELTDWSREYSIDEFPEIADASVLSPIEIPAEDIAPVDVGELPTAVSDATKALIVNGDDVERPINSTNARYRSRSELVYRATCDLVRAGCDDKMIAGILINPKLGVSASILEKTKPKTYAFRQIQSARDARMAGCHEGGRSSTNPTQYASRHQATRPTRRI